MRSGLLLAIVGTASFCALLGCSSGGGAAPTPVHYQFTDAGFTEPAGGQEYHCWFVDVPTGGSVHAPTGVLEFSYQETANILHHLVVFTGPSGGDANGSDRPCNIFEYGWSIAFAGGVHTGPLVFPTQPRQVAMPMGPTQRFIFQLHIVNASTSAVADDTKVNIDFTAPGEPYTAAGLIFAGNQGFTLSASASPQQVTGHCTVPTGLNGGQVFAVWPHMHKLGTHFGITHTPGGGAAQTLLDWPWYFDPQPMYIPTNGYLGISAGDSIDTTCTYVNTTGSPVSFGELTSDEMCYDFFYYFPAIYYGALGCFQ